jgi:voltage-gated potassium channel
MVDRNVRRIANARSATIAMALTFLAAAFVGAILIRIVDQHNFPTFGSAVWWAVQTVTTVGYGDIVPTTRAGRIVGGLEMVLGVSFIAFLTAGVTSVVIEQRRAEEARDGARDVQPIVDALVEVRDALSDLDKRLARIESRE